MSEGGACVRMEGLCKSYGDLRVLRHVSVRLEEGGIYCLMGPSGAGKTTLLRVLVGLESPDEGDVVGLGAGEASVMFQEDRLCEALTPVDNVALVMPPRASRRSIRELLEEILPADCMGRPALRGHRGGGRALLAEASQWTHLAGIHPWRGRRWPAGRTQAHVVRHICDACSRPSARVTWTRR